MAPGGKGQFAKPLQAFRRSQVPIGADLASGIPIASGLKARRISAHGDAVGLDATTIPKC